MPATTKFCVLFCATAIYVCWHTHGRFIRQMSRGRRAIVGCCRRLMTGLYRDRLLYDSATFFYSFSPVILFLQKRSRG